MVTCLNSPHTIDHINVTLFPVPSHTAALESSISQRAGFGQAWAIPSTQRSSYQRGSEGATKKDQSSQDRILGHDAQPPEDHNLKGDNKSKFEQEVAGSLDQALKQILSDS